MNVSKFQCPKGHLSWSRKLLEDCPHGRCTEKVVCIAGPHKPKKDGGKTSAGIGGDTTRAVGQSRLTT